MMAAYYSTHSTNTNMKEAMMTYIVLIGLGIIFSLLILGFFSLERRESEGRMINVNWLENDEKFHFISRWGA